MASRGGSFSDSAEAVDPKERFPGIAELLAALQADPKRRRRKLAGVLAAGVSLARWYGAREVVEARQISACEAEGAGIAAVWNEDVKARLRDGLLASGAADAVTIAENVMPYLDAQASAWRDMRTEACMATRVRREWSEATLDRSLWCLDERRMEMEALIAEFSQPDADTALRAVTGAASLSPVSVCGDVQRLDKLPALPPDRDSLRAVEQTLSRASALRAAGDYENGLVTARSAVSAAQEAGWPPLIAAAHWRLGDMLILSGKYADAEVALEEAYFQAAEVGAPEAEAAAAASLTFTTGHLLMRPGDGFRWARHAEVALSTLGENEDGLLRSVLLNDLAHIYKLVEDYAQAEALFLRVLDIWERAFGSDHPHVAVGLNNLGNVYTDSGAYQKAKETYERSLRISEKVLGPHHPEVATTLHNLAHVHQYLGEFAAAKALFERSLARTESALGPGHPNVANTLTLLAGVHSAMGDDTEAKALARRAVAIADAALRPDHPLVAVALNEQGNAHYFAREYEAAKAPYERAWQIRVRTLGPDHPQVVISLHNLANTHLALGELAEARRLHEQALATHEKAKGPDDPGLAYPLTGLARVAFRQGRMAEAITLAERAMRIRETTGASPKALAESRFILARALWDAPSGQGQGRDRERALALAALARDGFLATKGRAEELVEVKAFLSERSGLRFRWAARGR